MSSTAKSVLIVLVKTFVIAALAAAATYGASVLNLGSSEWRGIAAAGVAAVVAAAYAWVTSQHPKAVWADLLIVFAGTALGQMAAFGVHVFDVGAGQWRGVLGAALAAVVLAGLNYLLPGGSYGVGAFKARVLLNK